MWESINILFVCTTGDDRAHTLRLEMIVVNVKVIAFVSKVGVTQRDWTLVMKLVVKFDCKVSTQRLRVMMISLAYG